MDDSPRKPPRPTDHEASEPEFVSVAEIAAEMALVHPDKVTSVELDKDEQRTFRRHKRKLLGHQPQVRQVVASRVPAPVVPLRDVGRDARPATNARRRGSRRSSGTSPPDDPDLPPEYVDAAASRPTERRAAI
jgi:hypothetical protein